MKGKRRITALLLAVCMLFTAGCGARTKEVEQTQNTQEPGGGSQTYGRYRETALGLTGQVDRNGGFTVMEDGSYRLVGYNTGIWTSADQGETWTAEPAEPWFQLLQATYCPCAVFAPDGTMAALSNGSISDTVVQAAMEKRLLTEEEMRKAREEPIPEGEAIQDIWEQNQFGILATPEGELRFLDFGRENTAVNNTALSRLWFSPDNRLFGGGVDGAVYEIDQQDGSLTQLFMADREVGYLTFADNCLVAVGADGLYRYDLENNTLLDVNPALNTLTAEKIGRNGSTAYTIGSYPVALAASGDGKALYLSCRDGLYRGSLEGSRIERIIDGALSYLGDEDVVRLQVLEEERFLVQFADNSLILYTYDSSVPSTPEKELTVYSFMEEPLIRNAVTAYKRENPDIYVHYQIGYTGEDGISEEDAIKNLNTALAAGKGPDVLVFDCLRTDTYIKKGILADMSELFAGMQGEAELLPNIVEGMKQDGKLYLMPMCFTVPVIVGEREAVPQARTLTGLAGYMEENASEGSGGIIGIHDAEMLAEVLATACCQAWMQEDGTLDETALRDFLTQAKQIYDAENLAVTQTQREETDGIDEAAGQYGAGSAIAQRTNVGNNVMYLAGGYQKMALGKLEAVWFDLLQIVSLQKIQEDVDYLPYDGQGKQLFFPFLPSGINASSPNRDEAEQFIRTMFSKETQDTINGFPVNKAALQGVFINGSTPVDEDYDTGSSMGYPIAGQGGFRSSEGDLGTMALYWPDPEQTERVVELLTSVRTPAFYVPALYDVVCKTAPQVMEGTLSIDDGLEQIRKEMALYLAE